MGKVDQMGNKEGYGGLAKFVGTFAASLLPPLHSVCISLEGYRCICWPTQARLDAQLLVFSSVVTNQDCQLPSNMS